MHDIQLVKFATDILLMLAIIYMAARTLRPGTSIGSSKLNELEGSIRKLLTEAEVSSRDIEVALAKRKQDLQQLLFDLEATESRVAREMRRAQEQRSDITPRPPLRRSPPITLEQEVTPARAAPPPSPPPPAARPKSRLEKAVEAVTTAAESADEPAPNWERVNIYGEAITLEPAPATRPSIPMEDLKRVVESARQVMQHSSEVAQAAPRSIKQKLTPPAVEASEPETVRVSLQAPPAEKKLGVLGMKRQVQVL